jgi:ketosteroid isomerase-like protein/predicted enzyme related to lactoylglutathione lyase
VTATENKERMRQIFASLAEGDSRPFVDALADDIRWTITGSSSWSRTYDGKDEVQRELLGPLFAQFADRYVAEASRFIAEDDYVVVEYRGRVTTKAGQPYNNTYCYVFRLADGAVTEITEYFDTKLIDAVLQARVGEGGSGDGDDARGDRGAGRRVQAEEDSMKITASALSLTVADPEASARFLEQTFDFEREMAADGFVSLTRPDIGFNVIFLGAGLPTFKPRERATRTADGLLIVLVVDDIDGEYERLSAAGTAILTPIETEEWGERYFQVEDPNGVIVQLVQWVGAPQESVTA